MNLWQVTTAALLALVAVISPAQAQNQTKVAVDGKDYTVTEYPHGRFAPTHMVSLSGPAGSAMITVDKDGKIAASGVSISLS